MGIANLSIISYMIHIINFFLFVFLYLVNLKLLLYLYSVGIQCCTLYSFEDSRCYLNLVNGQYLVLVLPEGTHIVHLPHTCYLAAGASRNQHSVHRHGKVHIKKLNFCWILVIIWSLHSPDLHISNQLWNICCVLDI